MYIILLCRAWETWPTLEDNTMVDLKKDVDRSHLSKGYSGRFL